MHKDRIILHCDCNSFYASVAEMKDPRLKDFPMAVCGDPKSRHGIILAKNQKAKAYGVKTAETLWQAREKCPDLVAVAPDYQEYRRMHNVLNNIYLQRTDLVEPFGIDESWLDITNSAHLFGTPCEIADNLRKEIRENYGITISVGVSFNKVFAKLGSDYKKPDATTVISRENMKQIVWCLPCDTLLYVGHSAKNKLETVNIRTIGDLALADEHILTKLLGKQGQMLKLYAMGEDSSPVRSFFARPKPKTIGNGMTFSRNLFGQQDIKAAVHLLCEEISMRLKDEELFAGGVNITLKTPDFKVSSHQSPLTVATYCESEIARTAIRLIEEKGGFKKQVRSLTITAINLTDEPTGQLSFFGDDSEKRKKEEKLDNALAALKKKMGRDIINKAVVLESDIQ